MNEEEIIAAYNEIQAREKAAAKAERDKKIKEEKEAYHKKLIEKTKPFIGQPPVVIEGDVSEYEDSNNYYNRYVEELVMYLEDLPYLGSTYPDGIYLEGIGCRVRITIEVIGPAE